MDHSIPPTERRDKSNIQQIKRRWKGSHAQSQDVDAQKNHDSAWILHKVGNCNKFLHKEKQFHLIRIAYFLIPASFEGGGVFP